MASNICLKEQYLWVSNQRLRALLTFALQVGSERANSDTERHWVGKLKQFDEEAWPGIGFDLDEQFPGIEAKKFWATVFRDVARRIFLRQFGSQDVTYWQGSAIGGAYIIGRMLTRAVHEAGVAWNPDNEDTQEAESAGGHINFRG